MNLFRRKQLRPLVAIGRLSNPFIYQTQMFYCGVDLERLDAYLNDQARNGWKLHTINRIDEKFFFCVWERFDYGEKEHEPNTD